MMAIFGLSEKLSIFYTVKIYSHIGNTVQDLPFIDSIVKEILQIAHSLLTYPRISRLTIFPNSIDNFQILFPTYVLQILKKLLLKYT